MKRGEQRKEKQSEGGMREAIVKRMGDEGELVSWSREEESDLRRESTGSCLLSLS